MRKTNMPRLGTLIVKDGMHGMVAGSDSEGHIVVHWQDRTCTRLTPGEDVFDTVTDGKEQVREEILSLRQSGVTNMLDLPSVQKYAQGFGYGALLKLLAYNRRGYIHFIFTGELT